MLHEHHIIPRHIGGTDDPSNLVKLTIEEHAQAHKELYEKYGRWQDNFAWQGLSGMIGKEEMMRKIFSITGKMNKGRPKTGDLRRYGVANKGKKHTKEHNKKISESLMGHVQPQSQKDKVAKALCKPYQIIEPNGNVVMIENLNKYCRENNLDVGNMTKVAQGKARQHKGYECSYV